MYIVEVISHLTVGWKNCVIVFLCWGTSHLSSEPHIAEPANNDEVLGEDEEPNLSGGKEILMVGWQDELRAVQSVSQW